MADNEERRPGDWTHKQQRTYDKVNQLAKDPNAKKWYDDNFWIIFFLVLFWPVGIVLMWRSRWHVAVKVIVSVLLLVMIYFSFQMSMAVQSMTG